MRSWLHFSPINSYVIPRLIIAPLDQGAPHSVHSPNEEWCNIWHCSCFFQRFLCLTPCLMLSFFYISVILIRESGSVAGRLERLSAKFSVATSNALLESSWAKHWIFTIYTACNLFSMRITEGFHLFKHADVSGWTGLDLNITYPHNWMKTSARSNSE